MNPLHTPTIKVLKIGSSTLGARHSTPEVQSAECRVTHEPKKSDNRKLEQVEREIKRVKYERSQIHLKYLDLLNHELLPKAAKADFLVIYEEIEALSDELRQLYIKKRQIELTGEYKSPKSLDDATQNKIDALKNEKKSVSNIKNKTQKALQRATVQANIKAVQKYEKKLVELDLKWMDLESQIEKLSHV
jgi:hypothetical protein